MRYFLFFILVLITICLVIAGLNPSLFLKSESTGELTSEYTFKKATSNISKLKALLQNCVQEETDNEETNENEFPIEEKLLLELEIILAHQHAELARINYSTIREKSLKREVTPVDVQNAYREYESATLYLTRLLEKYPQGENLINSFHQ